MGVYLRTGRRHTCPVPPTSSNDAGAIWQCDCGRIYVQLNGGEPSWAAISQLAADEIIQRGAQPTSRQQIMQLEQRLGGVAGSEPAPYSAVRDRRLP